MKAIVVLRNRTGNVPQVPAGWDVIQDGFGWVTLYPLGREARPDVFVHSWLAVASGGQGAFVIAGKDSYLRTIHQAASRAWTMQELRDDTSAAALAIKALWKDERPRDQNGDVHQPGRSRYSMFRSIAGNSYDQDADNTADLP